MVQSLHSTALSARRSSFHPTLIIPNLFAIYILGSILKLYTFFVKRLKTIRILKSLFSKLLDNSQGITSNHFSNLVWKKFFFSVSFNLRWFGIKAWLRRCSYELNGYYHAYISTYNATRLKIWTRSCKLVTRVDGQRSTINCNYILSKNEYTCLV